MTIEFDKLRVGEKDYTGAAFGDYKVLGPSKEYIRGRAYPTSRKWWCECACGNIQKVQLSNLLSGNSHRCRNCGQADKYQGYSRTYLYKLWAIAKQRCYDVCCSGYKYYGERGVTMWVGWSEDSVAFCEDVKEEIGDRPEGMQLMLIDFKKGYYPGNLCWGIPSGHGRWHAEYEGVVVRVFKKTVELTKHISRVEQYSYFECAPEIRISTYGNVEGTPVYINSSGRPVFFINSVSIPIHKCVLGLFIQPTLKATSVIGHLNDTRSDNRVWNLAECSSKENSIFRAYNHERRTNQGGVHLWWLPESQRRELMPVQL